MQNINTNGIELILIDVKEGSRGFEVHGLNRKNMLLYYEHDGYAVNIKFDFDIKLIGLLKGINPSKIRPYVRYFKTKGQYKDYTDRSVCWPRPISSFNTMLIKHKINPLKNWYIVEKS